ncbi:MAG TPA: UTP--glucose-1-phosphate uridylyltransferase [Streptosporangiaceae bacterium]|nr:UTP--glucose-1-phosphate uridylyltransferase [Streptosporangiaceae bacterium]
MHTAAPRTAIIPVAGLGTRLLPATKAVPKGMLPLIDRPAVQYVVQEAAATGLTDVVLVTGADSGAFMAYFESADQLERLLAERGHQEIIAELRAATELPVACIEQDAPRGLGDAVLRCAEHVGGEPFAVLFGDNILSDGDDLLTKMIAARKKYGGTILALTEVAPDEAPARCVVAFEATGDQDVVRVTDLVEKPEASNAPSNWIMIGRCVCDPAIFDVLRVTPPGLGGEIQLSDALATLARTDPAAGGGVHGLLYRGRRFDTGNKQDYLRTTVELACGRPDLADQFLPWLRNYLSSIS